MGLVGYNQVSYRCRSGGSKYVDRFLRLVDLKDKYTVEGVGTYFQSILVIDKKFCLWRELEWGQDLCRYCCR